MLLYNNEYIRFSQVYEGYFIKNPVTPVENTFGQLKKPVRTYFLLRARIFSLIFEYTFKERYIFIFDNTGPEVLGVDVGGGFLDHFGYEVRLVDFD